MSISAENIPIEIQESLKLHTLKNRVLQSLNKKDPLHAFISSLSVEEVYEIIPPLNRLMESDRGYLFEGIAKKILCRDQLQQNPVLIEVHQLIEQILKSQFFQGKSTPDFLEITPELQIIGMYECKAGKTALIDRNRKQFEESILTVKIIGAWIENPDQSPNEVKQIIYKLNEITEHKLKVLENLKYTFALPINLNNAQRVESLLEQGVNTKIVPVTVKNLEGIYNGLLDLARKRFSKKQAR